MNEDTKKAPLAEAHKPPVGSVSVLASEEEPQHVPVSLGIDDDEQYAAPHTPTNPDDGEDL
jgi:hypothetical protein